MRVVIMMGIPASGKSTLANSLGIRVLASDELRLQHPEIPPTSTTIWTMMKNMLRQCIENNEDVVIDATNVSVKDRDRWLSVIKKEKAKGFQIFTSLYIMTTPKEVCLERNKHREARVPDIAIHSIEKRWENPTKEEYFDEIKQF